MDSQSNSITQAQEFVKRFRRTALVAVVVLMIGAVFYHFVEHWSWLDSIYFCVVSLATVGYGDLVPTNPLSKIFTIFYLLTGLSIFASVISNLVKSRTLQKHIKKISGEGHEKELKDEGKGKQPPS